MVPDDHILSPAKVLAHMLAKEKSDLPIYLAGSFGLQVTMVLKIVFARNRLW